MKNTKLFSIELIQLLNEVKNKLPSEDVINISEFIENNEIGLAFETLCTQLYEYDIGVRHEFYEKIFFLGKSFKIEPSIWMPIKKLIKYN